MRASAVLVWALPLADVRWDASLDHIAAVMAGSCGAIFFPFEVLFAGPQGHPGQDVLKTPIQRLVIHGAAHLPGNAPAVWNIVPDAHGIVVVIESIRYCIQKDFGLFSSDPIQLLKARVEHQPAMRGQPERRAILAFDSAGLLLALVPLGLQLVNAFIQDFEKIRVVDLGSLPVCADSIGDVVVVRVQSHDLVRAQGFASVQHPFNREDHREELAFLHDTALANMLMVDPGRQSLFGAFIYNALGIPIAIGILYPFNRGLLLVISRALVPGA